MQVIDSDGRGIVDLTLEQERIRCACPFYPPGISIEETCYGNRRAIHLQSLAGKEPCEIDGELECRRRPLEAAWRVAQALGGECGGNREHGFQHRIQKFCRIRQVR